MTRIIKLFSTKKRANAQASGFGGTVQHDIGGEKIKGMKKNFQRKITVRFNSDVSTNMKWKFEPQQNKLVVHISFFSNILEISCSI